MFLTDLISYIPRAALGSIVFIAAIRLIDLKGFIKMVHFNKTDAVLFALCFFGVLFLGIVPGMCLGIMAGVVQIIKTAKNDVDH